jgi:hypothetical protein
MERRGRLQFNTVVVAFDALLFLRRHSAHCHCYRSQRQAFYSLPVATDTNHYESRKQQMSCTPWHL